ncbi:hypothetical protein F5884DRAFT_894466 [Xylogone sp. PMI_703]|nr:hypothetical protein F5884DRAFT_894466 [Xylogone sp. PMI_703]
MRTLTVISFLLLSLSTFVAASLSWPDFLPAKDSLVVRQDNNNDNNDKTQSTTPGSSSPTPTPTPSGKQSTTSGGKSGSSTQSGKSTGKVTGKPTSTQKSNNTSHHTLFDPTNPAGGISLVTPAITDGPQYYKIGDFVTFKWNMTSVLATPTALDIMATCTVNKQLYTLAVNQTVHGATGAVTWDTSAYQKTAAAAPLLTEMYTLIIYDAASSISATAEAGYLAVFNQYTFGMYSPQPYVPLADYICPTCNGALGDMERRALGMVLGMGLITVLSFTWFVTGMGIIW